MENIQIHPTHRMVIANDHNTKAFFEVPSDQYRAYMAGSTMKIIEMKNHKRYGEITTHVDFFVDPAVVAEDSSVTEALGHFDNDVANVCISEWEAGNRYITYATIYRTLTGKVGESDATPGKVQLSAIKHSLKKLMNVQISVDMSTACKYLGYNNGKAITVRGKIIPARFVNCTVNGQKTKVIKLTAESPLLKMARLKSNQIISYDVELLNIPNQKNTPLNIALKHYAIRRVIESITHKNQMTPSITFEDVLQKCHSVGADNKKKHRVREFLKSVFEYLATCGVINSYQVNKKAGVFHSITFTFSKVRGKSKRMSVV